MTIVFKIIFNTFNYTSSNHFFEITNQTKLNSLKYIFIYILYIHYKHRININNWLNIQKILKINKNNLVNTK